MGCLVCGDASSVAADKGGEPPLWVDWDQWEGLAGPFCVPCEDKRARRRAVRERQRLRDLEAYAAVADLADDPAEETRDEDAGLLEGRLAELESLHEEARRLQTRLSQQLAERRRAWLARNAADLDAQRRQRLLLQAQRTSQAQKTQLEALQKTNVFAEAFHIWHDGSHATINTLRLGSSVPWPEVNAACGQMVLLLHAVGTHVRFAWAPRYRVVPMASTSRIDQLQPVRRSYHLQCLQTRDIPRFNEALDVFLDCVGLLAAELASLDPDFRLPYPMAGNGLIGDLSICQRPSDPASWTRACKYLLTNLKWLAAYASRTDQ
jgi:beclin 1